MSRIGHNAISLLIASLGSISIASAAYRWENWASILPNAIHWVIATAQGGGVLYYEPGIGGFVFFLGAMAGSTSPDWLEIPYFRRGIRFSLIPHRTLTHWPLFWVGIWCVPIGFLWGGSGTPSQLLFSHFSLAFAISGSIHILIDAMSPTGIPLVHPYGERVSVGPLYATGQLSELVVVMVMTTALSVTYLFLL